MSKRPAGISKKPAKLEFIPLGGAAEVGRSCYLVGDGEKYVMLDCGEHPKSGGPPDFDLLKDKKIVGVLISHSHRDHVGALPSLFRKTKGLKVFSTELTKKLSNIILKDAIRVKERRGKVLPPIPPKLEETWETKEYGETFRLDGRITATFKDAGHIPGSAQIIINWGGKKILYTGDICTFKTHMSGDFEEWGKVDVVISESTYGKEFSKPSGAATVISKENNLVEEAKKILQEKGRVLIPCFANGRAQEIMYVIARAIAEGKIPQVPCYSIGMLNSMLDIIGESDVYRDKVAEIRKYFVPVYLFRAPYARPEKDEVFREIKEKKKPGIIVSTPGMLTIGASSNLAIKIFGEPKSAIFIVGYQDEDSPGKLLERVEEGGKFLIGSSELKVKCKIKKFGIRGHAHPEHIIKNMYDARPRVVIFVHGDHEARAIMNQYALLRIKKCRFLSRVGRARVRFDARTWKYKITRLAKVPRQRLESFVVDGSIEDILFKKEFIQKRKSVGRRELSEEYWNAMVLKKYFDIFGVSITSNIWSSVGKYPRRVRFIAGGEEKKVLDSASVLLRNLKFTKAETKIDWIAYDGKAKFDDLKGWLQRYEPRIRHVQCPVFDSFRLGEGRSGLYVPPIKIFVNPIAGNDPGLKNAALYHENAHYLMDTLRGDLPRLKEKNDFGGNAFVEGAAEYLADKLGADKIFIETEKVGDDGKYYPTSESNPYVSGWYMFKTIDKVMGEKKACEILLKRSPKDFKQAFDKARKTGQMLGQFLKITDVVGRLYLRGFTYVSGGKFKAVIQYASSIDEGRFYVDKKVLAIKHLKERKSVLYRLGRFFGIIRHPWLEAECIGERAEGKEDFSYKIPPEEISRVVKVHKLFPVGKIPRRAGKLSHLDKKVLNYMARHGGKISVSKTTRDLDISAGQLRGSIERLKRAGKIEEE